MPRIRTIKPEFPQSESIGRLSRDARLLFIQLWTIADDFGRCRASARLLAGQLYPYDDDAIRLLPKWLIELEREGMVQVYAVEGSTFLQVIAWSKHQRVDNAGKSNIPSPPVVDEPKVLAADAEHHDETRGDSPRTAANLGGSPLDLGPRTKDLGPVPRALARVEPEEPKSARSKTPDRPEDVPDQVWTDWLAHRRKKSATVSLTVLETLRKEATAAGVTIAEAMAICVANGWQGFRADWVAKARASPDGGFSNGKWQGVPRTLKPSDYTPEPGTVDEYGFPISKP